MESLKSEWKEILAQAIKTLVQESGVASFDVLPLVILETPPRPEMGDIAFPMFPFARHLRMAPPVIAQKVQSLLENLSGDLGKTVVAGPYINVYINKTMVVTSTLKKIRENDSYGENQALNGQKIMIEFSCPNTNKPLHLGHLRNDAIGESMSRILAAGGAEVNKVNLINDRGIHICKSMLAYKEWGKGTTPESEKIKGDHFVGNYYVKFNTWSKTDKTAEERARDMLISWENNDPEVKELWETMNHWTIEGIEETYKNTGVSFDKVYFESQTYLKGKAQVLDGLEKGLFFKEEDGSIWVDMEPIGLDKKVLLRGDGTSLYLTQDLGTAISRHDDFPFDRLIYVVGSEQQYHFKVLFYVLRLLGFKWAESLFHLSYGMVNLPEGKMKSREGTVVDADDLLEELTKMAESEIREKGREDQLDDVRGTAEKIALGALHYFLLQATPGKDMVFNPKESLAFAGNTGPYIQYMGARISSIIKKYSKNQSLYDNVEIDSSLLDSSEEWELVKILGKFPLAVSEAASSMSCAVIAGYLYDLCKSFSRFYHEKMIVDESNLSMTVARIDLSKAVLKTLKKGMYLVNVPFLESM